MTMRILVTVSRSWSEWSTMRSVLEELYRHHPNAELVHGDARNGDRDAAGIWTSLGGEPKPWPAKWADCAPDCKLGHRRRNNRGAEYCPTAGMRRNVDMVESAPDLTVAFFDPKSRTQGALHCAWHSADAGIPTLIYRQGVAGVGMRNIADSAELGGVA